MKRALCWLIVVSGLVGLFAMLALPVALFWWSPPAGRLDIARQTWWLMPGFVLLINFLMAFSHAAEMGGESPALGLPTVLGWCFVWVAPFPWWALFGMLVAMPAIELGVVASAWASGGWLRRETTPGSLGRST